MSDSHEPSYYEIALTNRQVLIAFVILLVCLVAAFLSGVWVGHGDVPTRPERIAEGAPAADEEADGSAGSLSFFGDDARPEPANPRRDTTLAQDAGVDRAPSAPAPAAAPTPAPSTTPEPQRPAAAAPAPRAADPPPASRPSPPAAAPSSGSGDLIVQVFSSRDREQALKVVNRLQGAGRDAYLSPVEVEGQPMYRVRLGPFSDRSRAEQVSQQIRSEFQLDTWITSR